MNVCNMPSVVGSSHKRAQALSLILMILVAVLFCLPLFYMLGTSLKPKAEALQNPLALWGSRPAWENYERAWTYFPFGRFLLNSLLVGGATTLLAVITSSMSAYAFSRLHFRGRNTIFYMYLATLMIPQQVTIIPLYMLLRNFGWYNTYYALIIPPAFTAFGTFMMRQFFLTIPREMEEAGRIDGCNAMQLFTLLILPMSKPGMAALAIFSFVNSWKNFFWPLVVVGSDSMKTLPMGIYMFSGQYGTDWTALMAATAITVIPSIILFVLFQKNMVEGIALTGMGGR